MELKTLGLMVYSRDLCFLKRVCHKPMWVCALGLLQKSQVSAEHWFRGMAARVEREREAGQDCESCLSSVPRAGEPGEG